MATCSSCFCHFDSDAPWKKLCLSCWQKSKRSSSSAESELLALRLEKLVLLQKIRAYQLFRAPAPRIPDDVLARLIRLAHPDKHANSAAANEATAWLLAQRGAI